ncbi:hypothetical protein AB1Y20_015549 [Prymnesium parvum]|uniref:Hexosyltransferase n=1 Tax=Prymnesium parvum TaxID=97485 RepID=A0AB34K0S7_PRYPA
MSAEASGPFVLVGVMSSPKSKLLRQQQRRWRQKFSSGPTVRLVLGKTVFGTAERVDSLLAREQARHADLLFVDGREGLPHVGKVTEKSASWWQTIAERAPGYRFYCKCDDDAFIHHSRLDAVLRHVGAQLPGRAVYFGHVKWRGWEAFHRFQACGGGWGPAAKTWDDILFGAPLHGGGRAPACPHAAGPYPYMSGGMACMSAELARLLAADAEFAAFLAAARARNDAGTPCHSPAACARQPVATHMWHHEDAGVGFNVFRAVARANASAAIVPVTGHYNDAGVVERTASAFDAYWSSRALFVHGVKQPEQYLKMERRWTIGRPTPRLRMGCYPCTRNGYNVHQGAWTHARLPCRGSNHSFCDVDVASHFTCCGWPWLVPQARQLAIDTLRRFGGRLSLQEMGRRVREAARAQRVVERKGCVRDCLNLRLPPIASLAEEMERSGDVELSGGAGASEAERKVTLLVNKTLPFPPPLELWRPRPDGAPGP